MPAQRPPRNVPHDAQPIIPADRLRRPLNLNVRLRMNASERLHSGRTATHEGRFEEALSQFIWFHEHSLEEDRAYLGVRLSFALSYWMELAERYPPARAA